MAKTTRQMTFICGGTAVGKTALSLQLAQQQGAVVLSCDSLLFYRGMNIGTAKPTAAERSLLPHYGMDLVDVRERFTVGDYVDYVQDLLATRLPPEQPVVVVGGSGFYLKSFFAPVVDQQIIPDEVSAQVEACWQAEGLVGLQQRLRDLQKGEEPSIDWQNPRRLMKALERCLASGKTLLALQQDFAAQPLPWPDVAKHVVLVQREREQMHERIAERVDAMLAEGLVQEVEALLPLGIKDNPSAAKAIGYEEVIAFLESGSEDKMALRENIVINTRRLLRKQETWFRKQIPVDEVMDLSTSEGVRVHE